MKVYVVVEGAYSDQHVIGVYTTVDAAKAAEGPGVEWTEPDNGGTWWNGHTTGKPDWLTRVVSIESFDLDDVPIVATPTPIPSERDKIEQAHRAGIT